MLYGIEEYGYDEFGILKKQKINIKKVIIASTVVVIAVIITVVSFFMSLFFDPNGEENNFALGLTNAKNALGAQKAVSEMTNDMLKKNSELLKQGSIEIAKESERAIVDLETVKKTNQDLIETIDSIIKIHEEGSQKRAAAEVELNKIEGELKSKLLELKA